MASPRDFEAEIAAAKDQAPSWENSKSLAELYVEYARTLEETSNLEVPKVLASAREYYQLAQLLLHQDEDNPLFEVYDFEILRALYEILPKADHPESALLVIDALLKYSPANLEYLQEQTEYLKLAESEPFSSQELALQVSQARIDNEIRMAVELKILATFNLEFSKLQTDSAHNVYDFRSGLKALELGHFELAEYFFSNILQANPQSARALVYRAQVYESLGQLEAAGADLESLEALGFEAHRCLLNSGLKNAVSLAMIYEYLKDTGRAQKLIEQAIGAAVTQPRSNYQMQDLSSEDFELIVDLMLSVQSQDLTQTLDSRDEKDQVLIAAIKELKEIDAQVTEEELFEEEMGFVKILPELDRLVTEGRADEVLALGTKLTFIYGLRAEIFQLMTTAFKQKEQLSKVKVFASLTLRLHLASEQQSIAEVDVNYLLAMIALKEGHTASALDFYVEVVEDLNSDELSDEGMLQNYRAHFSRLASERDESLLIKELELSHTTALPDGYVDYLDEVHAHHMAQFYFDKLDFAMALGWSEKSIKYSSHNIPYLLLHADILHHQALAVENLDKNLDRSPFVDLWKQALQLIRKKLATFASEDRSIEKFELLTAEVKTLEKLIAYDPSFTNTQLVSPCNSLLKIAPNNYEILYYLEQIYSRLGKDKFFEKTKTQQGQLLELMKGFWKKAGALTSPASLSIFMLADLARSNQPGLALHLAQKLLAQDSQNTLALLFKMLINIEQNKLGVVNAHYSQLQPFLNAEVSALSVNLNFKEYANLSLLYLQVLKQVDSAELYIKARIAFVEALNLIDYQSSEHLRKAQRVLEALKESPYAQEPNSPLTVKAYLVEAEAAFTAGEFKQAETLFKNAHLMFGLDTQMAKDDQWRVYAFLVRTALQLKRFDAVRQNYRVALAFAGLDGSLTESRKLWQAELREELERLSAALAATKNQADPYRTLLNTLQLKAQTQVARVKVSSSLETLSEHSDENASPGNSPQAAAAAVAASAPKLPKPKKSKHKTKLKKTAAKLPQSGNPLSRSQSDQGPVLSLDSSSVSSSSPLSPPSARTQAPTPLPVREGYIELEPIETILFNALDEPQSPQADASQVKAESGSLMFLKGSSVTSKVRHQVLHPNEPYQRLRGQDLDIEISKSVPQVLKLLKAHFGVLDLHIPAHRKNLIQLVFANTKVDINCDFKWEALISHSHVLLADRDGRIIDPSGKGLADAQAGRIETNEPALEAYRDNPEWMLCHLIAKNKYGLKIADEGAMEQNLKALANFETTDIIASLLAKMISEGCALANFEDMARLHIWETLFPILPLGSSYNPLVLIPIFEALDAEYKAGKSYPLPLQRLIVKILLVPLVNIQPPLTLELMTLFIKTYIQNDTGYMQLAFGAKPRLPDGDFYKIGGLVQEILAQNAISPPILEPSPEVLPAPEPSPPMSSPSSAFIPLSSPDTGSASYGSSSTPSPMFFRSPAPSPLLVTPPFFGSPSISDSFQPSQMTANLLRLHSGVFNAPVGPPQLLTPDEKLRQQTALLKLHIAQLKRSNTGGSHNP